MKKVLAVMGSALLVGGMSLVGMSSAYAADAAAPTVAVVNVQQIFQQSPKIADLNKQLQNQFKGRQEKLIAAQKSLQDEVDQFKKESPTMSQKDKDALQKKIVDDQSSLSKDASAFQQDLSKEQNRIMKGVLSQLNTIVTGIAKDNHYTMVLDAQAVIFAADGVDITKQVAKQFDNK